MGKITVKSTANFEANLAAIEQFLEEAEAGFAFDALLDDLSDTVIPNLENHPRIGRAFSERNLLSVEALGKFKALRDSFADAELREYLNGDYLLLYALIGDTVYLLSVKHFRQLTHDFALLVIPMLSKRSLDDCDTKSLIEVVPTLLEGTTRVTG